MGSIAYSDFPIILEVGNKKMKARPVCDIVIVNWNSGSDLQNCVDALAKSVQSSFEFGKIAIVDNASDDGSADIKVPQQLSCVIHKNDQNAGFAVGCNTGAKYCQESHLLFLNPDVTVSEDSIDRLFYWLSQNPAHASSICSIALKDENGNISCTCSRFPALITVFSKVFGLEKLLSKFGWSQPMWDFDHKSTRSVDQVIGAFFLVSRELFDRLDGFSENYFLYYEEVDFCLRASEAGSHCLFFSEAISKHSGGGASKKIPIRRLALNLQSRLIYYKTHFSTSKYFSALMLTIFIEPFTRFIFALMSGKIQTAANSLSAYLLLFHQNR